MNTTPFVASSAPALPAAQALTDHPVQRAQLGFEIDRATLQRLIQPAPWALLGTVLLEWLSIAAAIALAQRADHWVFSILIKLPSSPRI
jgi:hypothetical protein